MENNQYNPLDISKINNCWQYMIQISHNFSIGKINRKLNKYKENKSMFKDVDINQKHQCKSDLVLSEHTCIKCRISAKERALAHQESNYYAKESGAFPCKSLLERKLEIYDLFMYHLSTIPAICRICGGIYGYCDNWVSKIINIQQIKYGTLISKQSYSCYLCSFKNKKAYNILAHAEQHLKCNGTGLVCRHCAENIVEEIPVIDEIDIIKESCPPSFTDKESSNTSNEGNKFVNILNDNYLSSNEKESISSVSSASLSGIYCTTCGCYFTETTVPPPTIIINKEENIHEHPPISIYSLLFGTEEITDITLSNHDDTTTESALFPTEHGENIIKIPKTAIFCEKCGNVLGDLSNMLMKLNSQQIEPVSFINLKQKEEKQLICPVSHVTQTNEAILKETKQKHLFYSKKICKICQSNQTESDQERLDIELYETLALSLSLIYAICKTCNRGFFLYDSFIPKIIAVIGNNYDHKNKNSYICLLCQKTNKWSFDAIDHAARHLANENKGLICQRCLLQNKDATSDDSSSEYCQEISN